MESKNKRIVNLYRNKTGVNYLTGRNEEQTLEA
jgi:hypothetical protein